MLLRQRRDGRGPLSALHFASVACTDAAAAAARSNYLKSSLSLKFPRARTHKTHTHIHRHTQTLQNTHARAYIDTHTNVFAR
uniref:Putative secreted protein n=1 Tax=Anopheles darlingi TaxID=43151 RepID=A0A2M4DHS9_ANODA